MATFITNIYFLAVILMESFFCPQMHGYDMGSMPHGTSPPNKQMHPPDLNQHHQSEDSFVTYLESDESSQESP